jgi:TonB family protein
LVEIAIEVDTQGSVREPEVIEESSPVFREAALNAVLQYKMEPARWNDRACQTSISVEVRFNRD